MAVIVCVVLLLPETLRPIAGRGEVRTSGIYRPLALKSPPYATERTPAPGTAKKEKLTLSAFTAPLKFAIEPDVFASLLFGGVVYAVYSMLSASTTASLQTIYGLNDLQVGLAFGANGIGCVLGSISTGIIVDRDYRKLKKKHERKIKEGLMPADPDFPIEKARLRSAWIMILIFGFSIFGYGWALETREHLVVPLVFQFLGTNRQDFPLREIWLMWE